MLDNMNNRKRTKQKCVKKLLRYYENLALKGLDYILKNKIDLKIENLKMDYSNSQLVVSADVHIIYPIERIELTVSV